MTSSSRCNFTLRINPTEQSQEGRLLSYLKAKGSRSKRDRSLLAIRAFYLVEALQHYGTRPREDLQKIAEDCARQLEHQASWIRKQAELSEKISETRSQKGNYSIESDQTTEYFDHENETNRKANAECGGHPYSAVRRRSGSDEASTVSSAEPLAELLRTTVGQSGDDIGTVSPEELDAFLDEI